MREWLVDLVGEGMAPVASFVLAAAIVVILVFVVIWVAKRALGGQIGNRTKGRGPRLAVMDVTPIDPKRKLVLVRRDEVEHLILIGGQNDIVIEANILRVAAGGRTARTEPSFRPEEGPAGERRPAATPQRLTPPAPAAPMPQRKAAGEQTRDGAPAVVSPLARAVPRAPAVAEDNHDLASTEKRTEPVLKAEPASPVPRPATAEAQPGEAERREPSFSVMPAVPPAPPTPVADRSGNRPTADDKAAMVAAAPVVDASRTDVASRADAGPAPQVTAARTAPEVVPPVAERVRAASTVAEEMIPGRPVPQDRPVPVRVPVVESAGPMSGQPLARTPVTTNPAAAAQNGVPRVSITGASEPVRRLAPVVAAPTRSMATPTYSPLSPQMFRQDGDTAPVSPAAAPEPVADRAAPVSTDEERVAPQPDAAEVPAPRAPMMREIAPRAGEPSSAVIAAAERQRELIRARPTPTMTPKAPAEAPAPKIEDAERAKRDAAQPESDKPETTADGQLSPAETAPERKPLEVRSFAATIQAGGRPTPAPAAVRPAPPVAQPAQRPPEPARVAPVVAAVAPVTAAIPEQGAVANEKTAVTSDKPAAAGDDAFAGLDDFLSSELDFGLDDVNWNDEPAGPAPEVRVDEPGPSETPADKTPRALSLEEEMERLLGDFNFETSERGRR